jgi:hypothetical protein
MSTANVLSRNFRTVIPLALCGGMVSFVTNASGQTALVRPVESRVSTIATGVVTSPTGCVSSVPIVRDLRANAHQPVAGLPAAEDSARWAGWLSGPFLICPQTDVSYSARCWFDAPPGTPNIFRLRANAVCKSLGFTGSSVSHIARVEASVEFVVTNFTLVQFNEISAFRQSINSTVTDQNGPRLFGPIASSLTQQFRVDQRFVFPLTVTQVIVPAFQMVLAPGTYRIECAESFSGATSVMQPNVFEGCDTAITLNVMVQALGPAAVPAWADINQDNQVTSQDLLAWLGSPTDVNGDGVLATNPFGDDAATLTAILRGQSNLGPDCNDNAFPDAYDIAVHALTAGTLGSADVNTNGIPDTCEIVGCDPIDFNANGVFPEDQDVVDYFDVLAGGSCPTCNDIDFNNNGVFPEDQDVIDFFNVLAGGNCP